MKGKLLSDDELINVNGGQGGAGNPVCAALNPGEDPDMLLSNAKLSCYSSLNEASKSLLSGVIIPNMRQNVYRNLKLIISGTMYGTQIESWEAN